MATWRRILGVLRKSPEVGDPLPDGELLARFAASRDQAAFELLVWRHAAMVFGVCRRAVRDEHLAEDAFQAVFLVLARKAGAVRGSNVAGWLFRIARRVAVRTAKRLTVAQPIAVEPIASPLPNRLEQDELRTLLDDEIARLPERFRLPVLLCYLGGLSTEDAARQLGIPRGTILSRLSTAREHLSARLTRRGVTVPAVVVATPNLVTTTVSAAGAFAARLTPLTTRSALVAEGVLRTMTLSKLVPVAALVVVTGLVSGYGLRPGPGVALVAAIQPEKSPAAAQLPRVEDKEHDRKERALQLVKLIKAAESLRAQIEGDERNLANLRRANALDVDSRAAARLDRQLALLEAEIFASERELVELQVRRDLLNGKIAGGHIPTTDPDPSQIEQDERVHTLKMEVGGAELKLMNTKGKFAAGHPSVVELEKQIEEKTNRLKAMRGTVKEELTKRAAADTRRGLIAKRNEGADNLAHAERVLEHRKRTRDELEKRLALREADTVNIEPQVEALKPKKELLARLHAQIAQLEIGDAMPPAPPAVSGVEAKLDVLIREVEALRKDVRELKKR